MTAEKLLVIGMGSRSDLKHFEGLEVEGKPYLDYLADEGIKVYRNPGESVPLITSIHRTTKDALKYARRMDNLARYHKVAAIFHGGLAFALPGVVAAEAPQVPVIAVPDGLDAFYNVYKIPDGTAVGVVSDLEKSIRLAAKMLNMSNVTIRLIVDGKCGCKGEVERSLLSMMDYQEVTDDGEMHYDGITLCLSEDPGKLAELDARVEFGIFGVEKKNKTADMVKYVSELQNSIVVGRPDNIPRMAARIVAIYDKEDMTKELRRLRQNETGGYPDYFRMSLEHFE